MVSKFSINISHIFNWFCRNNEKSDNKFWIENQIKIQYDHNFFWNFNWSRFYCLCLLCMRHEPGFHLTRVDLLLERPCFCKWCKRRRHQPHKKQISKHCLCNDLWPVTEDKKYSRLLTEYQHKLEVIFSSWFYTWT